MMKKVLSLPSWVLDTLTYLAVVLVTFLVLIGVFRPGTSQDNGDNGNGLVYRHARTAVYYYTLDDETYLVNSEGGIVKHEVKRKDIKDDK